MVRNEINFTFLMSFHKPKLILLYLMLGTDQVVSIGCATIVLSQCQVEVEEYPRKPNPYIIVRGLANLELLAIIISTLGDCLTLLIFLKIPTI